MKKGPSGDAAREWFTDLPLVTHEGGPIRFYTDMLQGKVVLITGFYTECDTICPRQNTVLSQLQNNLGEALKTGQPPGFFVCC